jgi:hypothetical protein
MEGREDACLPVDEGAVTVEREDLESTEVETVPLAIG